MKGPGFRLDLDVRRVWECPACGKRLKLSGDVTQVTCDCRGESSPALRLVERLRRTESPFDHVGFAAQKRIDAAIKRPYGPMLPESDEEQESVPASIPGTDAGLRPPDEVLPETTHTIDGDARNDADDQAMGGTNGKQIVPPSDPPFTSPSPDPSPP